MISKLKKYLGGLACVALATAITSPAFSQQRNILAEVLERGTVRIAISGESPKYSMMKPDGTPEGYEVDMGQMIADQLGVKVEWLKVDGAGRVTSLQTGKADITISNFTSNFKRSKVISFTDPYMVVGMVFYVKAGRDDIKTVDDLNTPDRKVGFGRGSTQEVLVPAAAPKTTIVRFSKMSDVLSALNTGRIDASALDNIGLSGIMAQHPGKYKVLPGRYSREDIALGLPRDDFEWWRLLNTFMRDFNMSGKNDELFKKWFGADRPRVFEAW